MDEVRVGVVAAEVGQGRAVADGARGGAEAVLEDLGGVGAGDGGHGVEGHAEAAGEHGADGGEVEERLHQLGVVGDGVDDLDGHVAELLGAEPVEVEVGGVEDLVFVDLLGALVDRLGDALGGGAAVADVVLDAEVLVRAAGVVAGGEDDAAVGAVLADDVGGGGGGEDAALADEHAAEAVGGGHLQRDLDDLAVEVAAVAADHQRLAGEVLERVEDRLDEVLDVVRLLEVRDLLAQAGGAGLLVVVGLGGMRVDHAGTARQEGGVEVGVGGGAAVPGDVGLHALALQRGPGGAVAHERGGAADGAGERGGVDGGELEAGGGAGVQRGDVGVDHGVGEAAGAGDDRDAAVAQAVELGQAAGLEARGDDDGVAAGLHQVGERLVVAEDGADAAGVLGGERAEGRSRGRARRCRGRRGGGRRGRCPGR